jgi:carbon monoxide dehydrogenase subunit G
MSMDGNFKVVRVSDKERKIIKEFSGRKGFAAANDMRDKLNKESNNSTTYYYVKGDLCLGV